MYARKASDVLSDSLASAGWNLLLSKYPNRSERPVDNKENFLQTLLSRPVRSNVKDHVHFYSLSAEEVRAYEAQEARKLRREGARTMRLKSSVHMNEVINAGVGDHVFSSLRKQDDFSRAVTRQPAAITFTDDNELTVIGGADTRMKKQKIYLNQACPRPDPTQSMAIGSGNFELLGEHGGTDALSVIGSDSDDHDTPITGLTKDLAKVFDAMMQESLIKKLLTDRVLFASRFPELIVTLFLLLFSDGVTPTTENLSVHLVKVLDPFCTVWKNGYSPTMRLAKHRGPEGLSSSMGPFLVQALSFFTSRRHIINKTLSLKFILRFLGGDNKNLGLCMARGGQACPSCFISRETFTGSILNDDAMLLFMPTSMLDKAKRYLQVLLMLYAYIAIEKNYVFTLSALRSKHGQLTGAAGVIRFPFLVENNSCAVRELLREVSAWLGNISISNVLVVKLLKALLLLDVLARAEPASGRENLETPKLDNVTIGFPLDCVYPVQATLHNDMHFLKCVAIDHLSLYSNGLRSAMASEVKVSSLCSEKMDYTHIRELFLNKSGDAFALAPPHAQELVATIREILLQQNCISNTSFLCQVLFLFDSFLLDPFNQMLATNILASKKRKVEQNVSKAAALKKAKTEHKDLTFKTSHYKHGRQHQALSFILDSDTVSELEIPGTVEVPVGGMSIPPFITNEVALERELSLDKRLGKSRALQAPDGSHIERSEIIVERMKKSSLLFKVGVSTDRLQEVTDSADLIMGRIYHPSFFNNPSITPHFTALVKLVQILGQRYSRFLFQRAGTWVIGEQPALGNAAQEQTYLNIRGICSLS